MIRTKHLVTLILVLSLFHCSISSPSNKTFAAGDFKPSPPNASDNDEETSDGQKGLRFRLSQGVDQPEARPTTNLAPAVPLSEDETAKVLKRLPPIKTEASDETEFALRERSLPPPRTGKTIPVSFPASENISRPKTTATGPLEVVRYAPEGDVPLAPNLSITFSQPMVPISSQEEAAANVPVRLSPQPPGKWRWVGTKTLLFQPDERFAMATRYSVTIPAGTRSATGGTLAQSKTWNFTTPPPSVKTFFPRQISTQRRDTIMFAEFDQRIDPAAVLRNVRVGVEKNQFSIRLATAEEIERQKEVRELAKHAGKDRWVAFRVVDAAGNWQNALPADSKISVSILPGTPSAEGPQTTRAAQAFLFYIFGPLRVTHHLCGYDKRCRPSDSWSIVFSNPLDASSFDDSKINIEPKIEDLKTRLYSNTLIIEANPKARTTYRVTLDRSLNDSLGQMLGENATVQFDVGAADQELFGSGEDIVVLDPFGSPQFPVYSVNHSSLKVRLYSVTAEDWPAWVSYNGSGDEKKTNPPGRLVSSRIVSVRSKPDEMVETAIDLRPALKDGFGQIVIIVEPTDKPASGSRYDYESIDRWVQRTNIGLDATVDDTDLIGWVTSLRDGKPLADVDLTLAPYRIVTRTAADGMARISLPPESAKTPPNLLVARRGKDVAILPEDASDEGSWYRKKIQDELHWYVFDDRGLYRPGEELHIKGWLRRIGGAKDGDVGLLNDAAQMGDHDAARGRRLIAEAGLEKLSLESAGWLLSVLMSDQESGTETAAIRHFLSNRVTETASTAHFVCSYSDSDYLVLNSDRRADGVILEALIGAEPHSDLVPKIVRGLLDHRTQGRWGNTQENVFILLALDRYFNTFEKVTPDFVARVWLGDAYAGEQRFKGRTTDRQQVNVPMRYLADQGSTKDLIVSKDGAGRLYYRIGMSYAPSDLNLKPADYGFTVERSYEAVDDPKDVSHDADGAWHIKAGARVRVRLTMVAPSRRYHVALVDPLPAGFESLNPALAVTEGIPEDKQQEAMVTYGSRSFGLGWWLSRPVWFDHQNLRDDRAEAFTSLLWEGVYNYSYVARATTPGEFVVPPVKAEEMYHPETFGRGKTDRMRIE